MMQRLMLALALVVMTGGFGRAETYGDKVKDVDVDKNLITLPVDGKDREFKVDPMVEVKSQRRAGKRLTVTPVKEGLKGVKTGNEVTLTTEKKDGQEVVTKIVILVAEKK